MVVYSYMPRLFLQLLGLNDYYSKGNTVLSTDNAGFDLFVPEDVTFAPGERKMVGMGVKALMSDNHGNYQNYWMLPRSSISKTGLMVMNSVGVIDKSYRGELIAALWNTTEAPVTVTKGQRLVQLVARDMSDITDYTIVDQLPETSRGSGGFGSTGK
jgi:dUTP pyrophosphatase